MLKILLFCLKKDSFQNFALKKNLPSGDWYSPSIIGHFWTTPSSGHSKLSLSMYRNAVQKHHQCVHALLVLISEKKLANFHRRLGCMRDCLIFPFERDFINSFAYHSRYNLFSHFFCFLYINSGMSMDSIGNITQLRPILKWISLFKKISDKVDVLPITFNSRGTKIWKKHLKKTHKCLKWL